MKSSIAPEHHRTLPLEWVRAFEATARCASFTSAANELGLTQSTVSQRVANLEDYLGAQLLLRLPKRVALTVDGEAWFPHVQSAMGLLDDSSRSLFHGARKTLKICATSSIIRHWLSPRLSQLSNILGVQITVQTLVLSSEVSKNVDTVVVHYGAGDVPAARKTRLFVEEIAPVASPELLASEQDWRDLPRIAVSGQRPGWGHWKARHGLKSEIPPALRFDTQSDAISAASCGAGVMLASLPLCETELQSGRLERVTEKTLEHHETYWLTASNAAVTKDQWEQLCLILTN